MINTTKIKSSLQENTIFYYWQMLRHMEQTCGDNIMDREMVEAAYRHWNKITEQDLKPYWLER